MWFLVTSYSLRLKNCFFFRLDLRMLCYIILWIGFICVQLHDVAIKFTIKTVDLIAFLSLNHKSARWSRGLGCYDSTILPSCTLLGLGFDYRRGLLWMPGVHRILNKNINIYLIMANSITPKAIRVL